MNILLEISARGRELLMESVRVSCPNVDCSKRLSIKVIPEKSKRTCRCPTCKTTFSITLTPQQGNHEVETDLGSYGFRSESSLSFLLHREQSGFKLTPEEMADKKRLLAEGRKQNPDACPACEANMGRKAVICVQCGLNLKTGCRLKTESHREPLAPSEHGDGSGNEATGAVLDVVVEIISISLGG